MLKRDSSKRWKNIWAANYILFIVTRYSLHCLFSHLTTVALRQRCCVRQLCRMTDRPAEDHYQNIITQCRSLFQHEWSSHLVLQNFMIFGVEYFMKYIMKLFLKLFLKHWRCFYVRYQSVKGIDTGICCCARKVLLSIRYWPEAFCQ